MTPAAEVIHLYTGQDTDTGVWYLLTLFGDGSAQLATRFSRTDTWSPPVELSVA